MNKTLRIFTAVILAAASALPAAFTANASAPRPPRSHTAAKPTAAKTAVAGIRPTAIGTSATDYESITDWKSIGTGRYADGFVAWTVSDVSYEMDGVAWSVEIEESESHSGLYRLVNPYAGCTYATDYDEVDTDSTYYMIVDATDPTAVFIPEFCTGVTPYYGYGNMVYGASNSAGTLADFEITFPANGTKAKLGSTSTNWFTCNNDQNFHIYLPGAKDYTFVLNVDKHCTADNNAIFGLTLGKDIATVKYAFSTNSVSADSVPNEFDLTQSVDSLSLPMTEAGIWHLIVVGCDSTGNQKGSQTAEFYCQDYTNDNWENIGTALFIEDFFKTLWQTTGDANTHNAEIQQSKTTPGLYRLVNPFANNPHPNYTNAHTDHNHYLTVNATDPDSVYLVESPVGGTYLAAVTSYAHYYMQQGDTGSLANFYGKLKNGTITFPAGALLYLYGGSWYTANKNADFKIVIPAEHTVTVASAAPSAGTVAITTPETEGASVTTTENQVTITATPTGDARFMFWSDAENNQVSTDAAYTYQGSADAQFTAHFGFPVTITAPENGTLTVTDGTSSINSGTTVEAGTELTATVTTPEGYDFNGFVINGETITPAETTHYFTVNAATVITAGFTVQTFTLNITVTGNGDVEAGSGLDEDTGSIITGDKYTNGATIPYGADIAFLLKPGKESDDKVESITSFVLTGVEDGPFDSVESETLDAYPAEDSTDHAHYLVIGTRKVTGNVTLSIEFTQNYAAITDIIFDAENGPVEYYNIQGMKVSAEDLKPGFYIARQGSKSKKILICK